MMQLLAVILFGVLAVSIIYIIDVWSQRRKFQQWLASMPTTKQVQDGFDEVYKNIKSNI